MRFQYIVIVGLNTRKKGKRKKKSLSVMVKTSMYRYFDSVST